MNLNIWGPKIRDNIHRTIKQNWKKMSVHGVGMTCGAIICSANTIGIEDAIEMAFEYSEITELETLQNSISESRRNRAKSLPDPTLFMEQEKLSGNSFTDAKETRFGISAPISFLWTRGSKIEVEENRNEVLQAQQLNKRQSIRRNVCDLYMDYKFELHHLEILEHGLALLEEARSHAQVLLDSGGLAPNDLSKIELLISQLKMEQSEVQLKMMGIQSDLSVLIGATDVAITNVQLLSEAFPFQNADSAVIFALENRSDWRAITARKQLLQSVKKEKSRSALPEASLELGAISTNEGRDGGFVGLSVDLPIFASKREDVNIASSQSDINDIEIRLLRKRIEVEVRSAFKEWKTLRTLQNQLEELIALNTENNLVEASFERFKAGDYSMLEHIDSIQSYIDTVTSRHEQELLMWHAAVKLGETTGAKLPLKSQ